MTALYAAAAVAVPVLAFVALLAYQGRRRDRRDLTPYAPLEDLMPERLATSTNRHAAIGDLIGELLDAADVSVTVRYRGTAEAPRFGLALLAKVLDEAGLIDDLPLAKEPQL